AGGQHHGPVPPHQLLERRLVSPRQEALQQRPVGEVANAGARRAEAEVVQERGERRRSHRVTPLTSGPALYWPPGRGFVHVFPQATTHGRAAAAGVPASCRRIAVRARSARISSSTALAPPSARLTSHGWRSVHGRRGGR